MIKGTIISRDTKLTRLFAAAVRTLAELGVAIVHSQFKMDIAVIQFVQRRAIKIPMKLQCLQYKEKKKNQIINY